MSTEQTNADLPGWDSLRHGGLLFDVARLKTLTEFIPPRLNEYVEQQLRHQGSSILNETGDTSTFVTFVLEQVCGLDGSTGTWLRGNNVPSSWGRRAITGETVKPRHLWQGQHDALLPIFIDDKKRIGIGKGRRTISQVLGWLRAGNNQLALITNGRQWRLLFAGLDYDAWCEWDMDMWFEEGGLSPQVTALRTLLNFELWTPKSEDAPPLLLQAIRDTRKGQAELSEELGEQVRKAVEKLIQGHSEALREYHDSVAPADIYRAACRVVMRLIVILFAESRDLLPRENALYHGSYGLNGLFDQLEHSAHHGADLANSWAAWPRILALFNLVRQGSHHPDLPVTAYGGKLFATGRPDPADRASKAIDIFERENQSALFSDRDVHKMLRLLTRTTISIRQGRGVRRSKAPVDFSDLSSEYIGILYEGLLDYELKTAPDDDSVVFLTVGNRPALPLSRLEKMEDGAIRTLFKSLKKKKAVTDDDTSEDSEQESKDVELESKVDELSFDANDVTLYDKNDQLDISRAEAWARRAVQVAKLVKKPLVARVVLPGEWYLVRWGGTRKGSGSFYTRPGLAVPTVQRTLRPLAYDPPPKANGAPDTAARAESWIPKLPEQILDVKTCDPACGSGTFPLAALRFLTDALYKSLQRHERIKRDGERSVIRLLRLHHDKNSTTAGESPFHEELIPCPPDDGDFEPRLKAVLRRHVVERCIYAVDLDPLAVELCQLSLWIETMNRELPFGFLDHKIKCGDALLGAWFDQFQHYPVMAWKNREGGDKNHSEGVHFEKNVRTKKIKDFVKDKLTPDLKLFLRGRDLFQEDTLEIATTAHKESLSVLEKMHKMSVQDTEERARIYHQNFLGRKAWSQIKDAMDLWCACWFWPVDKIEQAPLPSNFAKPPGETLAVAKQTANKMRFFHWELEFPDVFQEQGAGFSAILGNPPWDAPKPISKEFFSDIDPLYRTYGKQEALQYQSRCFKDGDAVERRWLDDNADFRARANFFRYVRGPFGDPEETTDGKNRFVVIRGKTNQDLHENWRQARNHTVSFSDPKHPFRHQGSADINLYKLFLESAHALLGFGGRLGFIVPSGVYSDDGTQALRKLFLDNCRWEWLFGIVNRENIFPIHKNYKFNPVIIEKGGNTEAIQTAFMQRNLENWENAESISISYPQTWIKQFSPKNRTFVEIQSQRNLEILEKIYNHSILLGDNSSSGWGVRYFREFDQTNDSELFPPRPEWENKGYRPDEYNRWLRGDWQPIENLLESLDINPAQAEPAELELEEWLLHETSSERQKTEVRLVRGYLLRPGDVARTVWSLRCAQPPYDKLPIPRSKVPAGIILSREGDTYIHVDKIEDIALPLYVGKMIYVGDWNASTIQLNELKQHSPNPEYLLGIKDLRHNRQTNNRIVFRDVSHATNERSFVATLIPGLFPCGNKLPILSLPPYNPVQSLELINALVSFGFDWVVRQRFAGNSLNWHIVEPCPVPRPGTSTNRTITQLARLLLGNILFSSDWLQLSNLVSQPHFYPCTFKERLRITIMLDAVMTATMGLSGSDFRRILAGCDYPAGNIIDKQLKGFWRVDKDKAPELRQTVLSLVAFQDLEERIKAANNNVEKGIDSFLAQNHGEGWMLPETLRLADYGLGHDNRAKQPQPVASRLPGPRFYDWQLAQSPKEAWQECHLHARNLLGADGYAQHVLKLIEQRVSNDEEFLDLLTLPFVRDFMNEDGYTTTIIKLRAKKILDETAYTQLLDHLRARNLLDEVRYRRQRERITSTPEQEPLPRVAELPADYDTETPSKENQTKMFE